MAAPFSGITDQLRRQQPAPAKAILPDITGRIPAAGQLGATIKSNIAAALQGRQGETTKVEVPWQGFAHPAGTTRAAHPTNQPPLAFQQGFRDLRRKSK